MSKRIRTEYVETASEVELKQVLSVLQPYTPEEKTLIDAFNHYIVHTRAEAVDLLRYQIAKKVKAVVPFVRRQLFQLCPASIVKHRIVILAAMRQGMVDFTAVHLVYDAEKACKDVDAAFDNFDKMKFLDKFQLQNMVAFLKPAIEKLEFITSPQYEALLAAFSRGEMGH